MIMEYLLRDVLAERGQKVVIDEQRQEAGDRLRGRPGRIAQGRQARRVERLHA